MFGQRAVALVVVLCSTASFVNAQQKTPNDDFRFTQPLPEWITSFSNDTDALFKYIIEGDGRGVAFDWLAEVTDTFGHRQTGSAALEAAIDFNLERLKADGFDNVHTEDVPDLPHWQRGDDLAELIEPRRHKLEILTIDGSPSADVTAEAIVVKSFEELNVKAKSGKVAGKIIVFVEKWAGYTKTVRYRRASADVEKLGAVGVLVKSVGPFSLNSPHTGSGARGTNIPAACITLEEAEMLYRMQERGNKLVIHLKFTSREVGTVTSRNTVFEITGSEKPNEIVLLSAHFDSWDVGQGALDDGGGCAAIWHALLSLKKLGFRPKRTIRVVLWTAEEQGLLGAASYHKAHSGTNETFFFVSETDQGAFKPKTWNSNLVFMGSPAQLRTLDEIVLLINSFGVPLSVMPLKEQGDVIYWANEGVPSINYISEKGKDYYFYFHHTKADYMTIFKDGDLEHTSAIFATLAHVIANMDSWTSQKRFVKEMPQPHQELQLQGFLSEDFRKWLSNNGFDEEKMTRMDLGVVGSYGGRRYPDEKVMKRPIIFVHGIQGEVMDLKSNIEFMIDHGYSPAELYATTYGDGHFSIKTMTHSCEFISHLRKFILAVRRYTGSQVDVIAYSMGVTLTRKAILGGTIKEDGGHECDIGGPLQPVHTFIGIAGGNYGNCICLTNHSAFCNDINGFWPGKCSKKDDCSNPETDCKVENYSQFLKELNGRQKMYRLAEKIVTFYALNDTHMSHMVWGRHTSVIPDSTVIKVYRDLDHYTVKSETLPDQLEQILVKQEIIGPLTDDFRIWLQNNGFDAEKFMRTDLGTYGSYGGRRTPNEKIVKRPVIFVHGSSGIALRTKAKPEHQGFSSHIEFLIDKGYTPAELYATTFGDTNIALYHNFTHNCEFVRHVRDFIIAVSRYSGSQVDIIAHSLGVTMARKAILGGKIFQVTGEICDIGEALGSIDTFIGIAGVNYGHCGCLGTLDKEQLRCNAITGLWPGQCSSSNDCFAPQGKCAVENRSRFVEELNDRQKTHRLARKIASLYSEDDPVVHHIAWGTATSEIPNSTFVKIYQGFDHFQVNNETFLDQYEQLVG